MELSENTAIIEPVGQIWSTYLTHNAFFQEIIQYSVSFSFFVHIYSVNVHGFHHLWILILRKWAGLVEMYRKHFCNVFFVLGSSLRELLLCLVLPRIASPYPKLHCSRTNGATWICA